MRLIKIHEDKRGYTYSIEDEHLGQPELTLFFTRQGFARGGCIHNKSDEHFCVVSGIVNLFLGKRKIEMEDGDCILIPKATPHYFVSQTLSVVLEWGATPEEKIEKHEEYRKIVDRINDKSN